MMHNCQHQCRGCIFARSGCREIVDKPLMQPAAAAIILFLLPLVLIMLGGGVGNYYYNVYGMLMGGAIGGILAVIFMAWISRRAQANFKGKK